MGVSENINSVRAKYQRYFKLKTIFMYAPILRSVTFQPKLDSWTFCFFTSIIKYKLNIRQLVHSFYRDKYWLIKLSY